MRLKVREYLRGYEHLEKKYPLNLKHIRLTDNLPRKEKKAIKRFKRLNNLRALVMIIGIDRYDKALQEVSFLDYLKK